MRTWPAGPAQPSWLFWPPLTTPAAWAVPATRAALATPLILRDFADELVSDKCREFVAEIAAEIVAEIVAEIAAESAELSAKLFAEWSAHPLSFPLHSTRLHAIARGHLM